MDGKSMFSSNLLESIPHKELSAKERFDVAREIIKHEDGLVNSRITWLQIFQGLLFTAFLAGVGLFKEPSIIQYDLAPSAISIALSLLACLGALSAFAAFSATKAAITQINAVEYWWSNSPAAVNFPPISGSHGLEIGPIQIRKIIFLKRRRLLGAHALLIFIPVWATLFLLFIVVVVVNAA